MEQEISNSKEFSKEFSNKDYEAANLLLDYSTQPTQQSSAVPTQGIINAHMSQPLYSQAVYQNKAVTSANTIQGSPVTTSKQNVQIQEKVSRAPNFNQASSSAITNIDYMPQLWASAAMSMSNNTQPFSVINGQGSAQGIK